MANHNEDLDYVKSLIEGGVGAWERFYSKNREKIKNFLLYRYPELGVADIEEICDHVQNRLTKEDFKALKRYRGECSFESFIIKATNWAIKDWFKANSLRIQQIPFDEGVSSEKKTHIDDPFPGGNEASTRINSLPDDLRQAFLLRYYDDFGFPPEEIRLLAKRTGRQIREITELMVRCFSPEDENLLTKRRKERKALEASLNRCSTRINSLKRNEEKLSKKLAAGADENVRSEIKNKIREINIKINALDRRRELINKKAHSPAMTPYELIAEIMGIENVSTIRSWVKKAKVLLAESLKIKPMQMSL